MPVEGEIAVWKNNKCQITWGFGGGKEAKESQESSMDQLQWQGEGEGGTVWVFHTLDHTQCL